MKNANNFTFDETWCNSFALRYSVTDLIKIENIYFHRVGTILTCLHYFELPCHENLIKQLISKVQEGYTLKFKYLNNGIFYNTLKQYIADKDIKLNVIDRWESPLLNIETSINDYLLNSKHSQIRKNYNLYCANKKDFTFVESSNCDLLMLWNDVLFIDENSWKKQESSDMKSLDREDLQYLPFLLNEQVKSSIVVVYDDNSPVAYSLMFLDYDSNCWYAVKWGASTQGRKKYMGFYCLFYHLEYLYNIDNSSTIDFWGRKNATYDKLRSNYIYRSHIEICKGSDE